MKLDSIGTLFTNAWGRFRERLATAMAIYAVPVVLLCIGQLLATGMHRGVQYAPSAGALVLSIPINILAVIATLVASIALIAAFGKQSDFAASYATGFKLFWASIWIAILVWFAALGGFVMLIIPGIMLAIQLSLTSFALVLDEKRGMAALALSREYLRGYWWAFLGRVLLLMLGLFAALIILVAPAAVLLGPIGAAIVYAIILLFFTPFAIAYEFEIYHNLKKMKPEAEADAAKAEKGFLKVAMVVGIVGAVIGIVLFCVLIFSGLSGGPLRNGYTNQYPTDSTGPEAGTSPWSGNQAQLAPTSGSVGTMVTIADPYAAEDFAATNTILMNGLVAARDVAPAADGSLTFTIPANLAPDCAPDSPCPQFLALVSSGTTYDVTVTNTDGTTDIGMFTVTGGAPSLQGGAAADGSD